MLIRIIAFLHPNPDPAILVTPSIIELKADVTNAQPIESTYPAEIWITEIMASDCQHARSGARKRLARDECTELQPGHQDKLSAVRTEIMTASESSPRETGHSEVCAAAIVCAAKLHRIPQTKEVPRLIQRKNGAIAAPAVKDLVNSSAVMDGGFGRVGTNERTRSARCGIGSPACAGDQRGFAVENFCFDTPRFCFSKMMDVKGFVTASCATPGAPRLLQRGRQENLPPEQCRYSTSGRL